MRKVLFIILDILLLIGLGFFIAKGMAIGNLNIWGIKAISEEDDAIDNKNTQLSTLVGTTYPGSLAKLDTSANTLTSTKEEYEDKAVLISDSSKYMQTEKYEIEYLWTKCGNYAKDENVKMKMDVVSSSTAGLYDLKFTVAGQYVDVTEFIYDIENDSRLGFKIEDFHMSAVDGGVQGTFACKEININIETIEQSAPETTQEDGETDTTNTTNTTTTDSTATENTTNTTNTNSTTTENTSTENNAQ